jgi:acetoin:2,6-dichlorophenolindophenol oxidoreductase subunit beta
MPKLRYQQAFAAALRDEMAADDRVFVLGEDVRESLRAVTRGLYDEFGPDRVLDAPLSEQAFTSFAMGAALTGFRPVVEYQIPSLVYLALEQIVNQANKFRLMTGGQAGVPVTYYAPGSGARLGLAGQHSDHPYAMLAQAGVKTLVPGTPQDAYTLFRAAIRDDDPVVVFAPAAVLGTRDEVDVGEPPRDSIGSARVLREGADVTVIAIGHLVPLALEFAESSGAAIEVIDLRSAFPLDRATLLASSAKTGRIVVLDDGNRTAGLAAEVIATVTAEVDLTSRPVRVTREDAVIPFAPELERELVPSAEKLEAAVHSVLEGALG